MNELQLINTDGEFYADSRDVAQAIEREHSKLLRTIREYCGFLNEAKIGLNEFFVEGEYKDGIGRTLPCYLITKKGCDMIAHKLTGRKGVLFTAAYVTAFEQMKETATAHKAVETASASGISSLIKNVRIVMEKQESAPTEIAAQTELFLRHFGLPVINGFVKTSPWEQITY